jgi:peptide/nickel transport system substrate-binding protein
MAVGLVSVLAPLSACNRGRPFGERPVRIVVQQELVSLDPGLLAFGNISLLSNVFEGLVRQDGEMRIEPGLAVSWATSDERTWTFRLRRGVRFHDGSLFTAADFKVAFDRVRNDPEAQGKQLLASIESVEAIDEASLRVTTRAPDALLLQRLSMHRVAKGATTQQVVANPVGTGPYRFVHWEPGRRIELAAFPGYWGGEPKAGRVEFLSMPSSARLDALRRGDIDLAPLPPDLAAQLPAAASVSIRRGPSLSRMFLWMGGLAGRGKSPLGDERVRRAVALSIDRRALSAALLGDGQMAAFELVPKTIFGYAPGLAEPVPDREEARRLLAAAGYPQGFDAPILHGSYGLASRTADALADMLGVVGIRARPQPGTDDATLAAALGGNATGFIVEQWTYDDGDAGSFLRDCVHTRNPALGEGVFNPGFSDATMDRLIDESLVLLNDVDRLRRYHEVMGRALHVVPAVPLFDRPYVYGMAKGIRWQPRADGFILAADLARVP